MEGRRPILLTLVARACQLVGALFVALGVAGFVGSLWSLSSTDSGFGEWPLLLMLVLWVGAPGAIGLVYFRFGSGLLRSARPGWAALRGGVALAVPVALFLVAMSLYWNVGQRARLTADQGTLEAMRSAAAIYYRDHGSFPEHPGNYINPTPPVFHCANLAYTYSPATGEIKITSTNTVEGDCQ